MPATKTSAPLGAESFPDDPSDLGVLLDQDVTLDPFATPGADGMFTVVPVLMCLVLAVFVVMVILKLVQAGTTLAANSSLPEQVVTARVVGKRTQTEGGGGDSAVRTLYFATFELTSGERIEVGVPRREYGQLVEGDEGRLTHQGTWYRGFERRRVIPLDGTWEAPGGPSLPPPTSS